MAFIDRPTHPYLYHHLNEHNAVMALLTSSLRAVRTVDAVSVANVAGTYANGTLGVGATLTKATAGAFPTTDGVVARAGMRVLLTAQTTAYQNGYYELTRVGSSTVAWQLTREGTFNQSAEMVQGSLFLVISGTTYGRTAANGGRGTIWSYTGASSPTVGTTSLTFAQDSVARTASGSTISDLGGDLTFRKEAAHVIKVAASTTAATAGGALSIAAGVSGTSGAGGALSLSGGAAASGGGGDGGALSIDTGAKDGAGSNATLTIAGTNAEAVDISRTGKTTTIKGHLALAANGNVSCAAGTTAVDLSAGTGTFKPPTGIFTFQGKQAATATANDIADPGNGQAIPVTTSGVCSITSAGAGHTRTVAAPTFSGQWITLSHDVDGGDVAVTFASAFNQAGNVTWTSDTAGEYGHFVARRIAGALRWAIVANDGGALS